MAKIKYDKEEDILWLSKGRKVKTSIDVGDFVIDVDHKGFITGIEILNASLNLKLTEEQLNKIKKASMSVTYKPNHAYISLMLSFENKEKDVTIPLSLDLGHGSEKTEKTSFAVV